MPAVTRRHKRFQNGMYVHGLQYGMTIRELNRCYGRWKLAVPDYEALLHDAG